MSFDGVDNRVLHDDQKTFGSSHPRHLFTDDLLHIETAMVFSLKERRRRHHSEAGCC